MLAATAAAAMPFCHWNWGPPTNADYKYIAPSVASSVLKRHLKASNAGLSVSTLYALFESAVHYLVGLWPKEEQRGSYSLLAVQVAQVYSASRDIAPDTACAAAVVLAATAMAFDSYPGGKQPSHDLDARQQRAMKLLAYYKANKPTNNIVSLLFLFGFIGLLPHLSFKGLGDLLNTSSEVLHKIRKSVALYNFKDVHTDTIHTLPSTFSLLEHAGLAAWELLTSVGNDSFSSEDEPIVAFACSSFLLSKESLHTLYPRIYGVALSTLQRAKTKELQDICIKLVDSQPLPNNLLQYFSWFGKESLLHQLCRTLPDAQEPGARFALVHFRLLVADVMVSPLYSLEERQSALRPLLSSRQEFSALKPSESASVPSEIDKVIAHVKEIDPDKDIIDSMFETIQLIADFCEAKSASRHEPVISEWETKRQELQNSLKQNRTKDEAGGMIELHAPLITI